MSHNTSALHTTPLAASQAETKSLESLPTLEISLRALFADVLDQSPDVIGRDDDFFALGGDSLMVIKLVARIRRTLQVGLTPGDVFDHPSVAGVAAFLRTP